MAKILIIGQAPPAVTQDYPYSTTMLWDWFKEIGINTTEGMEMFEFDAVYGEFPGFDEKGGHKKPTETQMLDYWDKTLKGKVYSIKKIIVLGGVAKKFILPFLHNHKSLCLIHPSKRNYGLFLKNKESILAQLKEFIYDN